ncbi:hypothetical protein HYFRA_00006361 [Hymenoscyphus fraxineus]|uniref:O-methyltransferase domain-containing protein n=1 Tax=Hymenoscyphus fraxineus TaxID=746836 RepID=A0A9N9KP83_9HELO|nr:hypothetical protein HYFRA_00006361 [Hymenoscyphus fraxineus]
MANSRIQELSDIIAASVATIQRGLKEKRLPLPSFDEDSPTTFPLDLTDAQNSVIDATTELRDLLMEPMLSIHSYGGHNNSLCQQAICRYGIASMVPVGGKISFADIAKETPLTEQTVARLLRHAMTMRIFQEPTPGFVSHTKFSKILINPTTNDWLRAGTEEMWPASTKVLEALEKYPGSQEPSETGYTVENKTTDSIYAFLGANPERAGRFGNAMAAYLQKPEHSPHYITDYYDWASLGSATVVHLGGGAGQFAIEIAKKHANLSMIVQDMGFMMGPREAGVPDEVKGRVMFEEHDFFAQQTVEMDAIYIRWALRNWSDKYVLLALRAQIPKLKSGSTIIIQDIILPEAGKVPLWKERYTRSNDLSLLASFNSRERTVEDWKSLFQEADKGFVLKNVFEPQGSALGILEFKWQG